MQSDGAKSRIFECETDILHSFDASLLESADQLESPFGIPFGLLPTDEKFPFPAFRIRNAQLYWKSHQILTGPQAVPGTDVPELEELLAPGPVRVIRQVPLS